MENRNGRPPYENRPARQQTERNGQPVGITAPRQQAAPARQPARQPQQRQPEKRKRPRSESRWFRAIIMVLATVGICAFFALFILQSANDLFGLNQKDLYIEVEIPEDPTLPEISSILAQSGVVDQRLTFQLYAMLKQDEYYYGGKYVFNTNMGYDQILTRLRTGNIIQEEERVFLMEGWNVYEIAMELEKNKICDAQAFLDHLETGEFNYEFMDQLEVDPLRFRRLEGYVFPDTYDFYVGENVDSVARKFFSNFDRKINTARKNRMREMNMTLDETLTLASIIQKETGGVGGINEMKMVSSVFHNRMNMPEVYPKLQSDVTRNYVNRFIKPFLDLTNQPMYDAYNTYARDGLPVGPICNPGEDAIDAALDPADTNNFFFVTDVENTFYYSETAQEHYQKVAIAQSVQGEGEIHGIDTD